MHLLLLREYVPLKQGLRLCSLFPRTSNQQLREYVPLKQGLRLANDELFEHKCQLREYVPLKQGLRRDHEFLMPTVVASESMFH